MKTIRINVLHKSLFLKAFSKYGTLITVKELILKFSNLIFGYYGCIMQKRSRFIASYPSVKLSIHAMPFDDEGGKIVQPTFSACQAFVGAVKPQHDEARSTFGVSSF